MGAKIVGEVESSPRLETIYEWEMIDPVELILDSIISNLFQINSWFTLGKQRESTLKYTL